MGDKKGKSAPPKLHKFMHPRNPYRTPPSFKNLAQKYASFRAHCSYGVDGKIHLNFKDPLAVRELTTCLLEQDFDLKVSIPEGRLVPTLPLRLNYLLWIEDLLSLSGNCSSHKDDIIGLDIGCGASCVYPLLATKQTGWRMVATEADDVNFESASSNVEKNNLQNQIKIHKVDQNFILKGALDNNDVIHNVKSFRECQNSAKSNPIEEEKTENGANKPSVVEEIQEKPLFDFTMCNPPFFGSIEEADSMSKSKRSRGEPSSAPTGAVHETVTEGGEVAFIFQMIEESLLLKEKVRIFSTMIGTKSHIKVVKEKLRSITPAHFAVVEFCQGRTMRWGIAWTFDSHLHLKNVLSKKQMADAKPLVLVLPRTLMTVYTVPAAWARINKWLHQLKISVQVFKSSKYFVGANIKAYKPTWLNQRRKKRERQRNQDIAHESKEKNTNGDSKDDVDSKDEIEDMELSTQADSSHKRKASDVDTDEETEVNGQKVLKTEDSSVSKCEVDAHNLVGIEQSYQSCQEVNLKDASSGRDKTEDTEIDEGFPKDTINDQRTLEIGGGLECILRAKLQVKQNGALISMEALYLRGSAGKDGVNQILQYMRNQLTNS